MSICSIIITFLLGIAVYYIRSCILLAYKQKHASLLLECYLNSMIDDLDDYGGSAVYFLGEEWHKRELAIVSSNKYSAKEQVTLLAELEEKTKKEIFDILNDSTHEEIQITFKDFLTRLKTIPKEMQQHYINTLLTDKQNMIDGKTYISDEEAMLLGDNFASDIVKVKTDATNFINHTLEISYSIFNKEIEFPTDGDIKSLQNIFWKLTCACKNISYLKQFVKPAFNKSVYTLTIKNIKSFVLDT